MSVSSSPEPGYISPHIENVIKLRILRLDIILNYLDGLIVTKKVLLREEQEGRSEEIMW